MNLLEQTQQAVARMKSLLDDPHPGLATWNIALRNAYNEVAKLFDEPDDPAKTERKACLAIVEERLALIAFLRKETVMGPDRVFALLERENEAKSIGDLIRVRGI